MALVTSQFTNRKDYTQADDVGYQALAPFFGLPNNGRGHPYEGLNVTHFNPGTKDRFLGQHSGCLPRSYIGQNDFMTGIIMTNLAGTVNFGFIALPFKQWDGSKTFQWSTWIFNDHTLGVTPDESVSRVTSCKVTSNSASLDRRGLAVILDHNFHLTPEGRQAWVNNMTQVYNATSETLAQGAIMALVTCAAPRASQVAASSFRRTLAAILAAEVDGFAQVQKKRYGYDILLGDVVKTMHDSCQKKPNCILVPEGVMKYVKFRPEETSYTESGRRGAPARNIITDGSARGAEVHESRTFHLGPGEEHADPCFRAVSVGGYFVMDAKKAMDDSSTVHKTANRDTYIYSESVDGFVRISFPDALTKCLPANEPEWKAFYLNAIGDRGGTDSDFDLGADDASADGATGDAPTIGWLLGKPGEGAGDAAKQAYEASLSCMAAGLVKLDTSADGCKPWLFTGAADTSPVVWNTECDRTAEALMGDKADTGARVLFGSGVSSGGMPAEYENKLPSPGDIGLTQNQVEDFFDRFDVDVGFVLVPYPLWIFLKSRGFDATKIRKLCAVMLLAAFCKYGTQEGERGARSYDKWWDDRLRDDRPWVTDKHAVGMKFAEFLVRVLVGAADQDMTSLNDFKNVIECCLRVFEGMSADGPAEEQEHSHEDQEKTAAVGGQPEVSEISQDQDEFEPTAYEQQGVQNKGPPVGKAATAAVSKKRSHALGKLVTVLKNALALPNTTDKRKGYVRKRLEVVTFWPLYRPSSTEYVSTDGSDDGTWYNPREVVQSWAASNVFIPITVVGVRPNATYDMGTLVAVHRDEGFGNTLINGANMMLGDNAAQKMHYAHFTLYAASVVFKPEQVVLAENAFSRAYLGGNGHESYDITNPKDMETCHDPRRVLQKDIFYVAVPGVGGAVTGGRGWKTPASNAFSITGTFDEALTDACTDETHDELHYETARYYSNKYNWQNEQTAEDRQAYDVDKDRMNTLVFQGHQLLHSASITNGNSFTQVVRDHGHWGPLTYPGCGAVRRGAGMFMEAQDAAVLGGMSNYM